MSRGIVSSNMGKLNIVRGYIAEYLVLWLLDDVLSSLSMKYSLVWHGFINVYGKTEYFLSSTWITNMPLPVRNIKLFKLFRSEREALLKNYGSFLLFIRSLTSQSVDKIVLQRIFQEVLGLMHENLNNKVEKAISSLRAKKELDLNYYKKKLKERETDEYLVKEIEKLEKELELLSSFPKTINLEDDDLKTFSLLFHFDELLAIKKINELSSMREPVQKHFDIAFAFLSCPTALHFDIIVVIHDENGLINSVNFIEVKSSWKAFLKAKQSSSSLWKKAKIISDHFGENAKVYLLYAGISDAQISLSEKDIIQVSPK